MPHPATQPSDRLGRDAAWYRENFGRADDLLAYAGELQALAEAARASAERAAADARAAAAVTELFDGFPLTVWKTGPGYDVHSPLNHYSAVAYPSARDGEGWCVRIDHHTFNYDSRETPTGGLWLGPGWTETDAIHAAKTWVATGIRPVNPTQAAVTA